MKAVATLLEHRRIEWSNRYLPSGIQPNITAATAARKPTTVAWTWKRKRRTILKIDRLKRTTESSSVILSSYPHLFARCKGSMLIHFVEMMITLSDQEEKCYASRKGFTNISETQE